MVAQDLSVITARTYRRMYFREFHFLAVHNPPAVDYRQNNKNYCWFTASLPARLPPKPQPVADEPECAADGDEGIEVHKEQG